MNILITGGLGYIGGRVADYLRKREEDTNIFLTTRDTNRRLHQWVKDFTVLQMDLLDEGSISRCLRDRGIDVVIHLAALNEIESMRRPGLALEINTKGTYRLLCAAKKEGINKFIYFSTFHVYGDTYIPVITEGTATRPFHPYAITHRAAEDFVNHFRRYHNMKTLIFRLSNGYGYPMDKEVDRWTLVFNDLCRQLVRTGKIVLKSSGRQYRDFISLQDVARAVYHFLFIKPDDWGDGLYNLGGNCTMSILDVAEKICSVYRKKNKVIRGEMESQKIDETAYRPFTYSIEKILKTGFQLKGDMTFEIEKTVALCQEFIR